LHFPIPAKKIKRNFLISLVERRRERGEFEIGNCKFKIEFVKVRLGEE